MRVFITGASGLIGSHLVGELVAAGHEVVGLCRDASDTTYLDQAGCVVVRGDIRSDAESLAPLMEGCQRLVHAAAQGYAGGSWRKVRESNVDGTRNVLTAARLAGVEHVTHVSTVAVYGGAPGLKDEQTPIDHPIPAGDLYARSKREAEEVVRGIEEQRGLPVTIVRPSAVYGERDRLMAPAIARVLRLPLVPLLGDGENTLPVVYAGNVASGLRLVVERCVGGETFNLAMDSPLTQSELFERLADGMGKTPRFVALPGSLVRSVGGVLTRLGMTTPGAQHLPLERLIQLGLGENPFPTHRIREHLGWAPSHAHEEALLRTGAWLLANP
jgi:nucleoside-diphosphate-sugar epimerase